SVLLAVARTNGCGVLESNWSAPLATEALRSLGGSLVEVFCEVEPAESRRRYLDRAASRHPGHFDRDRGDDWSLWEGSAAQPVAGGWPVIRLDTSVSTDIEALTRAVVAASAPPN
ncbi:MAG: hypothetical protein ABMA25_28590, partial [Ilumatobacteraceae bacterium]